MSKFTVEMAERQEAEMLIDALIDGCIELNDTFLEQCAGEFVREVLGSVPEQDRAWYLDCGLDDADWHFLGTPGRIGPRDIWLNVSEIEVQFEGSPDNYFQDPDEWYIEDGSDLAYLSVGYGLIIKVDVEAMRDARGLDHYNECLDMVDGPGKYEGEMPYVPHFHQSEGGEVIYSAQYGYCSCILKYDVLEQDKRIFQEIGPRDYILLHENNQGFVQEIDRQDVKAIVPQDDWEAIDWEELE